MAGGGSLPRFAQVSRCAGASRPWSVPAARSLGLPRCIAALGCPRCVTALVCSGSSQSWFAPVHRCLRLSAVRHGFGLPRRVAALAGPGGSLPLFAPEAGAVLAGAEPLAEAEKEREGAHAFEAERIGYFRDAVGCRREQFPGLGRIVCWYCAGAIPTYSRKTRRNHV